jgi:hypothetical protein
MSQKVFRRRIEAFLLCFAFLTAAMKPCFSVEKPKTIPGADLDRSVTAALSHQGIRDPKVISHIDLTEPFGTVTQWTFVAVQDGGPPSTQLEDRGPILICLVKAASPDCTQHFYEQANSDRPWFNTPYHLFDSRIVYAGRNQSSPLLLVQVCAAEIFDGNCGVATALYRYDRKADRFTRVFLNVTGHNNNEVTRFVESGPLQGAVIVNYPTEHAPYTYWIEVYRAGETGRYARVLRYRGRTGYNDGNPLAVADSEMPEILHRLGLWQPGDPLPAPPHPPQGCTQLFIQQGEERCRR